jgi:hypothetical protein
MVYNVGNPYMKKLESLYVGIITDFQDYPCTPTRIVYQAQGCQILIACCAR